MENIENIIRAEERDDDCEKELMKQMRFESTVMVMCPICGKLLSRQTYDKGKLLAGFTCKKCDILLIIKQNTKTFIME